MRSARRLVERRYPEALRQAGIGGTVVFWVFVDTAGRLGDVSLHKSSGFTLLDEAAESVLWELDFDPARLQGWPVPVWIQQSVTMTVRPGATGRPDRAPTRFALGSRQNPVAEAVTRRRTFEFETEAMPGIDATPTGPGERFPELIRPDDAERRLNRIFRERGPRDDLGVDLDLTIDSGGRVQDVKLWAVGPEGESVSEFVDEVVRAVAELRFRPAIIAGAPKTVPLRVSLVFAEGVGLIPSVPAGPCGLDPALARQPQATIVDEPPRLLTPTWERARVIAEVWPTSQRRRRQLVPLWVLVDERGRVCDARPIRPELKREERWLYGKGMQIMRRFRYVPARADGEAVAAWHQELLAFSF